MPRIPSIRPAKTGFRWRLKEVTQDHHDRLDAMMSRLDLTQRADLARFFYINLVCYEAMAATSRDPALDIMIRALRDDLAVLGHDGPAAGARGIDRYHPLAGRYLLSGSRMGTRILRKRWSKTRDPLVAMACSYFDLELADHDWAEVCAALDGIEADGRRDVEIVSDTRRLFDRFIDAYENAHIAIR